MIEKDERTLEKIKDYRENQYEMICALKYSEIMLIFEYENTLEKYISFQDQIQTTFFENYGRENNK